MCAACGAMTSAKGVSENLYRLPCGGEVRLFVYDVSGVFYVPHFMILYLSEVSNEAAVSPRGKWLFEGKSAVNFSFL